MTYTFDAQNRLLTATNNTTTSSCSYDALNRCVSRTINGVTTLLFYDRWNLIEEWTTGGVQVAHYVHGPRIDEILVKVSTTNAVYYHDDGLGSVTHLTGTNGVVIERYTYDIFGAVTIRDANSQLLSASSYSNRFLFTGREWLAEISLYDYRNRIYWPELGRFLQTDPIRFAAGDVDLYRYVRNNPINTLDAFGLASIPKDAEACFGAHPLFPDDPVCDKYGERKYLGASLKCFCKFPLLRDSWANYVRGCLACMDGKGVSVSDAHKACYESADKNYKRPTAVLAAAWCACRN